jgi:serine/threonine protein kinase
MVKSIEISNPEMVHSLIENDTYLLVLFAQKERKWKIADFGISTEATSKHARTTIFASGTPCYRAPELLSETPNYTRKVDIWAMGCILYELLFEKKTFAGDWDVNAYRTSKSLLPIPLLTVEEESKVLQSHLSGIIRELLNKNWTKRPRSTDTSMAFRAYSIFFHPSHIHEVLEVNSLPLYREWKELMVQLPNEVDLLYRVAGIYDRRDVNHFPAWAQEVIRRNDDVTKKLTKISHLTQALVGPTEFLRLLGPVDENLRSWWASCTLLADAICGGRKASIEMAMLNIALLAHLVTRNNQSQCLDLVDGLYAIRSASGSGLVRLTDHQYFQQHRGLCVAPTDGWRDQNSKPIQLFTIAQNISNAVLYRTVARLCKVNVSKIRLWIVSPKVYSIGAKYSPLESRLAPLESKRL